MRISDWSSDVCSSDLAGAAGPGDSPYRASDRSGRATIALPAIQAGRPVPLRLARGTLERAWHDGKFHVALPGGGHYSVALEEQRLEPDRSEEHTSEPQALTRISYAGFCLKKKQPAQIYN